MQKIGKLEYMLLHTHYGRVCAAIWMPRFQENCVESGVKADLEPRNLQCHWHLSGLAGGGKKPTHVLEIERRGLK